MIYWTTEDIVNHRLKSHVIPVNELSNGGYENLSNEEKREKIKKDFDNFLTKRAELNHKAAKKLCDGEILAIQDIFEN